MTRTDSLLFPYDSRGYIRGNLTEVGPQIEASSTKPATSESLENPYCPGPRPVQTNIIKSLLAAVVVRESFVRRRLQVIAPDTISVFTLLVDGSEDAISVLENPYYPCPWPVEGEVIELATMLVVEGEDIVSLGFQVIPADSDSGITLPIHWSEGAICVLENPNRSCSRPEKGDMVELSTVVIIESEDSVR